MAEEIRDRAWEEYTEAFRDTLAHIVTSGCMVHIGEGVPEEITSDVVQAATEMGMMLLLNKPLLVIVPRGATIPPAVRRAAAVVIDNANMDDPKTQDRIVRAVRKLGQE